MTLEDKKTYITSAVRSRFLFSSLAEGEKLLGMQLKSWQEKNDPDFIETVYDKFNRLSIDLTTFDLQEAIELLIGTSDFFIHNETIDSKRSSSLRKFALRLFYWSLFSENAQVYSVISKEFLPSHEEVDIFINNGFGTETINKGNLDTVIFLLLCFNALKPYVESSRPRKTGDDALAPTREFISLVESLKTSWPDVGSLSSFPEFDQALKEASQYLESDTGMPAARMWALINNIVVLKDIRMSPNQLTRYNESAEFITDFGIWIDSHDMGRHRFWIFPANLHMAFCYENQYGEWTLRPFEWFLTSDSESSAFDVIMIPPEISYDTLRSGKMDTQSIVSFTVSYYGDDGNYMETMELDTISPDLEWLKFDKFFRLKKDSSLHSNFLSQIRSFYSSHGLATGQLKNPFSAVINVLQGFVAMDKKYLYVQDRGEVACKMVYESDTEEFNYIPAINVEEKSICELVADPGKPLYRFPASEEEFRVPDKDMRFRNLFLTIQKILPRTNSLNKGPDLAIMVRKEIETYRRFKDAALSTRFPASITIYHFPDGKKDLRRLCFNASGVIIDLDTALALYGVKTVR